MSVHKHCSPDPPATSPGGVAASVWPPLGHPPPHHDLVSSNLNKRSKAVYVQKLEGICITGKVTGSGPKNQGSYWIKVIKSGRLKIKSEML